MLSPLLPFICAAFGAQGFEYFDFNFNLKPIIWTQDAAKQNKVKDAKAGEKIIKEDIVFGDKPLSKDETKALDEMEK